jgi:hypothetical protein
MHHKRHQHPAERLTKIVKAKKYGYCNYCKDNSGEPGMVVMKRDSNTFKLQPTNCWCTLCGQRYFVLELDMKEFLGYTQNEQF